MAHPFMFTVSTRDAWKLFGLSHPKPRARCTHDASCDHNQVVCACHIYVEEEADEVSVVEVTNAIIHPWTVMVWEKDLSKNR